MNTCLVVVVSCILNLLVILVLMFRKRKLGSMEVFIIALALADIMFSLIIHPMLIATSFGANSRIIFTPLGRLQKIYNKIKVCQTISKTKLLAPTGAQGVTIFFRPPVCQMKVCLVKSYFVGESEPKILRLVLNYNNRMSRDKLTLKHMHLSVI